MTNDEIEEALWDDDRARCAVREEALPMQYIPRTPATIRFIEQIVGCGTSVGANYCEADDAVSKKKFRLRCGTYLANRRMEPILSSLVIRHSSFF